MLFPKKQKSKKKRMRHPASILHDKNSRTCYLCVVLHDNWNEHRILDEHHIFGGPNRKNSEEYGLKVYLCHDHHIYGPEAVHNNARIRHELQRTAQRLFIIMFYAKIQNISLVKRTRCYLKNAIFCQTNLNDIPPVRSHSSIRRFWIRS